MEKNETSKAVATTQAKPKGIDPRKIFAQLLEDEFDPTKAETLDLVWVERMRGKNPQILSILDRGNGSTIEVFPVVSRFQPKKGGTIRCYVVYRKNRDDVLYGYAIPMNIREAARTGQWLGVRNNIIPIRARKNSETGDLFAFGPNGKVVVFVKGFAPALNQDLMVIVTEEMNRFVAHCEVPVQEAQDQTEKGEEGLMLLTEGIGAVLEGVDKYGFKFGGHLYDTCEILGVPATATLEEAKDAYSTLMKANHPDKKIAEYRELTGDEPSDADKQEINREAALIDAAFKKMKLVRDREAAEHAYMRVGRRDHKWIGHTILVSELATKLGIDNALMKHCLKRVGYDMKVGDHVSDKVAWTAAGYLKKQQESGAIESLQRDVETSNVETLRKLQEAMDKNRTLGVPATDVPKSE